MNKMSRLAVIAILIASLTPAAHAALYDRGNGMVYDSDQDITWLLDASYAATQYAETNGAQGDEDGMMTWVQATAWAENLEYGGYDDWRLPAFKVPADQLDKTHSNTGGTDQGQNVTTGHSELAYLWYEILGNTPQYNPDGTKKWEIKKERPLDLYPINLTADGVTFVNFQWNQVYALGLMYQEIYDLVWCFQDGYQGYDGMNDLKFFAWAVRDGDVAPAGPVVNFGDDAVIAEGASHQLVVTLSEPAPEYPHTVELVIGGTAQAGADHDLGTGVTFVDGETSKAVGFTAIDDGVGEGDETVVVSFGDGVNAGSKPSVTFTITERNLAPTVSLTATQDNAALGAKVTRSGGNIVVQATATDPNPGDSLSYDWSMTSSALADLDGSASSFTFDPSQLATGVYQVSVRVTDDAAVPLSTYRHLLIQIVDSLPALSAELDSDGDGIDDATEGYIDSNGNGIPDYLDAMAQVHVVPVALGAGGNYLARTDAGVRLTLGRFARQGQGGGVQLSDADLDASDDLAADADYPNVVGIFDFEAHDLPEAGQSVRFVFPLQTAIPADAVYRKFSGTLGWSTFVEDSNNKLYSTTGTPGFCPAPGDASWSPGLTEGHWCVQIEIEDGGANDEDGAANGVIVDPGAISAPQATTVTSGGSDNSSGTATTGGSGAMGYLIFVLGLLAAVRRSAAYRGEKTAF